MPRALAVVMLIAAMGVACGDDADPEAFCGAAERAASADLSQLFARFDPTSPETSVAELESAVAELRSLRDAADGSVEDDLSTLVSLAEDLVAALDDLEEDPAGARERVAALRVDYPDAGAASQRVVDRVREACGVDLDPGTA